MAETRTQHLDKLIEHFDNAMLVTQGREGGLHARPMAVAEHRDHGTLYFATSRTTGKTDEVDTHAEVAVTMQGEHRYLALSGRAEIVRDRDLIERFFSRAWKIWFPEGPDDPNLVLIKVDPASGEYWDMSENRSRMRFMVEAGKAVAQDREIDTDKLSGHGQADLG
jgi:general stress protein 26